MQKKVGEEIEFIIKNQLARVKWTPAAISYWGCLSILVSSGYMPRSGIVVSFDGFIPSFLRNLHTIFYRGCISLHSHQQCKNVPFSPHLFQHLLFVDFLIRTILTGVLLNCVVGEESWESFGLQEDPSSQS